MICAHVAQEGRHHVDLDLTPLSDPVGITSGGATLVTEAAGEGPAVICLHAGVADRRSWYPVAPYLRDAHRMVAYDRRGFGDTVYDAEPHDHVDDLVAVMDTLGLVSAVLVGNSQGGRVAVDTALHHPERVDGLVLFGPAWTGAPTWEQEMPEGLARLDAMLDDADESGDVDEINRLEAWLWLDGWAGPEGRVGGTARRLFLDMNQRALTADDPGELADLPPAWPRLAQLTMPATVGEGDRDLPWALWKSRQAAEAMPAAHLEVLSGVAHLPSLERPQQVATLIRDLVARTR